MRFHHIYPSAPEPVLSTFPAVVLVRDDWDDFTFKTTFGATLWLSNSKIIPLGDVKIMRMAQASGGFTEIPKQPFERLGPEYCSLGQNLSYYELLYRLGPGIYEDYLRGLRDVVLDRTIRLAFEDEPAFKKSLLRTDAAVRALEDGHPIFQEAPSVPDHEADDLSLSFKTSVGGSSFLVNFNFEGPTDLPRRVNVVIGYNGTGKTTLLSNLAMVASKSQSDLEELGEDFYARWGPTSRPPSRFWIGSCCFL